MFTNAYVSYVISLDDIASGNFKIPEKKLAEASTTQSYFPPKNANDAIDLDDPPF